MKNTKVNNVFILYSALHSAVALVIMAGLLTLGGCKICESEDCVHGECKSGTCHCDDGWSGAECDRVVKGRFDGLYATEDRCYWTNYNVKIIGGTNGHDIRIIGLHGQMDTLYADVDKDLFNWFNIPEQPFSPPGYTIEGSGEQNNNILLNYSTKDEYGDYDDICIATLSKQ
jgi:hypothetical protein